MRINDRGHRNKASHEQEDNVTTEQEKPFKVFRINRPVHLVGFSISEALKEQLQTIEQSGSPCIKRMVCVFDDDLGGRCTR